MDASGSTTRDAWATVARAASGGAAGPLGAAIRHALGAGVAVEDLVDALRSGDRSLDQPEATALVETERARAALIGSTYARIAGDWAAGG